MPARRSSQASVASASAARWSGSRCVICDPTWLCSPTISDAAAVAHPEAHLARIFDRHAELVVLAAGRNVRMAARIDVGVHPDRDPGAASARADAMRVDALDLPFRFGVDAAEAELDGPRELRVGFADPGEDDFLGRESGAERHLDLPARIGVGGGPRPRSSRAIARVELALSA